jgi:hypothetical protein
MCGFLEEKEPMKKAGRVSGRDHLTIGKCEGLMSAMAMTMAQAALPSARRSAEVGPDDLAKAEVDKEERLRIREEKRG